MLVDTEALRSPGNVTNNSPISKWRNASTAGSRPARRSTHNATAVSSASTAKCKAGPSQKHAQVGVELRDDHAHRLGERGMGEQPARCRVYSDQHGSNTLIGQTLRTTPSMPLRVARDAACAGSLRVIVRKAYRTDPRSTCACVFGSTACLSCSPGPGQ